MNITIIFRYVCISGAADQLQSNYAGDFRSILRTVFLLNVTADEEENELKDETNADEEIDEIEDNNTSRGAEEALSSVEIDELPELVSGIESIVVRNGNNSNGKISTGNRVQWDMGKPCESFYNY